MIDNALIKHIANAHCIAFTNEFTFAGVML